jgi:hypothetical protein
MAGSWRAVFACANRLMSSVRVILDPTSFARVGLDMTTTQNSMTTAGKYKLVLHYLQDLEWAGKLALSMENPVRVRVEYSLLTLSVYTVGEVSEEDEVETSVRFLPEPISWADQSVDLMARIERQQTQASNSIREQVDAPLFERLLAAPVEEWDEQGFLDATDALSDGDRRPRLVMGARTYAKFRKAPRWIDSEECQGTTLRSGLAATIMGCYVFIAKQVVDTDEVFIVSRRSSQVAGPLEVGVRVLAYDAEAKSVTFGYAARISTQGTPEVRRFRVGDLT